MVNKLNEKQSYKIVIAAIICSLIIIVIGLTTGMVYAVRAHRANDGMYDDSEIAHNLLVDAAYNLRKSMSALRLCNEEEPAESIGRTALIHAVRAETALECHYDEWTDSRNKEAFLNDVATILHSYTPMETIELSYKLYEYSAKFFNSVTDGEQFDYSGELMESDGETEPDREITEDDIAAAKTLVDNALGSTHTEYIGAWNGHIEFNVERDGNSGYAVVCGNKIAEYSFMRADAESEQTDVETSKSLALKAAAACGYDNLSVIRCEKSGRSVAVIMCKTYDGAVACDDYATAVVHNDTVVSFSAGKCDCEHKNIPTPKKTEREASKAAENGGEGMLVVRTMNGKERICYEYRYELEDGTHYVYVCAESGKQIDVK